MSEILYGVIASIISLLVAGILFLRVQRIKVINEEVLNIWNLIKEGAMAFLKREYTAISIFVIVVFLFIFLTMSAIINELLWDLIWPEYVNFYLITLGAYRIDYKVLL